MGRLVSQTVLYSVIVAVVFCILVSGANGYSDAFYLRFTTPPQSSMILGTSRAAQGLLPQVLDQYVPTKFFNYSFTIAHSPYGEVYYNSILHKLDSRSKKGIFIVAVDPWSLSAVVTRDSFESEFPEAHLLLANTKFVNLNPNIPYIIQNFKGKYYTLIAPQKRELLLHDNGWLEVSVPMDSESVLRRTTAKFKEYKEENLPNRKISATRLKYFSKTIDTLKKHGEVYIVRLPAHSKIIEMEHQLAPNFDSLIQPFVAKANGYLDLAKQSESYVYTDGNHLYKESGAKLSEKVGRWIAQQRSENKQ